MKNIFVLLFIIFSFRNPFVGSGTAVLTCKSESGKTVFIAYLQDIVGLLQGAEFTIDNSTMKFDNGADAYTIFDSSNGVFTLYIQGKPDEIYTNHKYIQFWSIPSTFKTIKNDRAHQIFEFKAKIYGTEPRPDKESHCPVIELNCKLEYKV